MAVKLIALYKKPDDVRAFDDHYENVHTPLALKMPGLRKLDVSRVTGSPMGEAKFYLVAELTFDSKEALDAAMASSEGRAAAQDLMGFAGNLVHLMVADVVNTPAEVRA